MFNILKEKLKNWVKKVKEVEEKPKIKEKKEKKKTREKEKKEGSIQKSGKKEDSKEKKPFVFLKFKKRLTEEKFEELFSELELILLQNNVALEVVERIKSNLKDKLIGEELPDINIKKSLKQSLDNILIKPLNLLEEIKEILNIKRPVIITFIGINGSGKTTTIAKIAHFLKKQNLSCCLAAADTFRAASIEQLEKHASNLNIPIIKKDYGADPASVGFDAIQYAKKHHTDVVLIDTAGRMNTKDSLMKEIEKITRVTKSDINIFVGESITGNDATEQARAFSKAVNLTGIILTKADIDEKGGTAISVGYITKKPIFFLGTGQDYKDLEVFNKDKLLKNLGLD